MVEIFDPNIEFIPFNSKSSDMTFALSMRLIPVGSCIVRECTLG
jgi:hypothetical protein